MVVLKYRVGDWVEDKWGFVAPIYKIIKGRYQLNKDRIPISEENIKRKLTKYEIPLYELDEDAWAEIFLMLDNAWDDDYLRDDDWD